MTETLYRKYRPLLFSEIVNQKSVVKTLTQALANHKVAHAYLFSGPRGTGKTTIARILTRALSCKNPHGPEPDNQCDVCTEILAGRALDVVEIDAASNRGIDDVRRLKEEIRFGPQRFKYKVFILDEAHMLTRDASNALLKSLEEPPAQTIFILATTEVHKLLPTIISRCQRLDFHHFNIKDMAGRLTALAQAEGFKLEDRAARAMAVNAQGSLRDAESVLGKVLALVDNSKIEYETVQALLGVIDTHAAARFISELAEGEASAVFKFIERSFDAGLSMKELLKALIEYARKVALVAAGADLAELLAEDLPAAELKLIEKQAAKFTLARAVKLIDICREELTVIEYYPLDRLAVEMAVMKFLSSPGNGE